MGRMIIYTRKSPDNDLRPSSHLTKERRTKVQKIHEIYEARGFRLLK